MQEIIEGILSHELLTAMESNMIAFWSSYGRANGSTLQATSDVVWFYTGIQDPLFNGVLYAKLNPDGVEAILDSLQAKIDEQGAPALWWIGPQSKPDHLGSLLEQHGLQPAGEVPGMAVNLGLVDDEPKMIANFTIQKVSNTEMQALWAQIVAIGTGSAYIYSTFATFYTGFFDKSGVIHAVYFDTAAVIITFILLGKLLEARAKGQTSEAIKKLMDLQAKTARVLRDGKEVDIPIREVVLGDLIIVRPGEKIPVDGIVTDTPDVLYKICRSLAEAHEPILNGSEISGSRFHYAAQPSRSL